MVARLRPVPVLIGLAALMIFDRPLVPVAQQAAAPASANGPVMLTNQQDRQRMMDLLKITMFPSGPGAYLASTYDETTANPYPNLPDPLLMNSGTKVTTPAQWAKRRAEIVELFDREVYGRRPKVLPKVKWEVLSTTTGTTGNTPVVTKQLVGHVDNSAYPAITVDILASLSTPADATGPVPVVLMFGGGPPPAGVTAQPNPCAPPGGVPARGAVARRRGARRGWGGRRPARTAAGTDSPGADCRARMGLRKRQHRQRPG